MLKQKKVSIPFYKHPQFFHTLEDNNDCIELFGSLPYSLIVFSMAGVLWQKVTGTNPEMYQVCKIARNCGYMMAFGKRNWKASVKIGEYSGEASLEALGVALTIHCIQTLREKNDVKSAAMLQGLHAYAAQLSEAKQINLIISGCNTLRD